MVPCTNIMSDLLSGGWESNVTSSILVSTRVISLQNVHLRDGYMGYCCTLWKCYERQPW